TLFEEVIRTIENGGKAARVTTSTTVGYTKEQAEAIQRLVNAKDNYERLGLHYGASREDINRSYRKLAMLIHPDKSVAPGSEEAFKVLVDARKALLK
ncbi:dnaJ homolog subfamily C member 27-like, partial [Paramuricea clavata]